MATAEEYMQELIRQREELGARAQSALDATRDPLPELSGGEALYAAGLGLLPALIGAAFKGKRGASIGAEAGAAGVESFGNLYSAKAEADRAANSALAQTLLSQQTSLQNDITQAALQSSREIADRESQLLDGLTAKPLGALDRPVSDSRIEELRNLAKRANPEVSDEELEARFPYDITNREYKQAQENLKEEIDFKETVEEESGAYYSWTKKPSNEERKDWKKSYLQTRTYLGALKGFEEALVDPNSTPEKLRAALAAVINVMPERDEAGAALTPLEFRLISLGLSQNWNINPLFDVTSWVTNNIAGLAQTREGQAALVRETMGAREGLLTAQADALGVDLKPMSFVSPKGKMYLLGERIRTRNPETGEMEEYRVDGQQEDGRPLGKFIRRVYGRQ